MPWLAILILFAQFPELPPQRFQSRLPDMLDGHIRFCIDAREPANELDRQIAELAAELLLIEPIFIDVGRTIIVEAEFEDLYVDLVDRCDFYLGFKLYSETYPEWLVFSREFYTARFVLLTRNDTGFQRLRDIPPGSPIGVTQGTMGDIRFLTYNNSLLAEDRWQRLPLGTPSNALSALGADVVDALVIWEPEWLESEYRDSFQVLEAPLISEPWIEVGAATLINRNFELSLLDEALANMDADGSIRQIVEEFGFPVP